MSLTEADFYWDVFFWKYRLDLLPWYRFANPAAAEIGGAAVGSMELVFAPEGREEGPLSSAEIGLVQWFVDHQSAVYEAALTALLKEYPVLREGYGYSEEELAESMPEANQVADLLPLVSLESISVHPLVSGDLPYVGIELSCQWDEEHGVGILLHGSRVVEVGGASSAHTLWIARKDAEK